MFAEDVFDLGRLWERDLVFFDVPEDLVNLKDHVLAALDGVVVWFVEIVGGCIKELNKVFGGQFGDYAVGVFRWDEQLIVAHRRRPEQ